MLTKDDLKAIRQIVEGSFDSKFSGAFAEGIANFWSNDIAPFLDNKFNGIEKRLEHVEGDINDLSEDMDDIQRKLNQNRVEHDRIFVKLDSIEKKVDGHEGGIKKLEKTLQTS